ncbi:AF4/FMR2 family member 4 [Scaptodrosophila lebanonensis]|uniref:AF4/FMR2 family member 4 n=1 Tax=Drosophila lebanonensis TaxID=7225 RepID=A0A6J2UI69_DROLE|nr:AF4/FMR2 family member 4 [Scaptodrosophila lebanonensis]
MGHTMDDVVYQCSNQNSIYVLNASYNAYSDFGSYAHLEGVPNQREINCSKTARQPIEAPSCTSGPCNLQHKLKSFASSSTTATAVAAVAAGAAAAAATMHCTMMATTIATTMPATMSSSYVNPVATSMSTAMCSPATTALQKLFNCSSSSVGVGGIGSIGGSGGINSCGGICQNVSHRNQQQNHKHSNNNCSGHNNGAPSCLSAATATATAAATTAAAAAAHRGIVAGSDVQDVSAAGALLGSVSNKKKCTNVKSTLIAKKTKFLKFLEEEKWRNHQMLQQQAGGAAATDALGRSNEAERQAASTLPASFVAHSAVQERNSNRNNSNSLKNGNDNNHEATTSTMEQQSKLNNWSINNGNSNSNSNSNKLTNYSQQQQQMQQQDQNKQQKYKQQQQTAKSSYELYQEAADILGLSCTLCDNCRCLDCQSGYFDCDDDDSYSEHSLMDEYDEFEQYEQYDDYTSGPMTGMAMVLTMQQQRQRQQQQQEHTTGHHANCDVEQQDLPATSASYSSICYAVNCQHECNNVCIDEGPKASTSTPTSTSSSPNSDLQEEDASQSCLLPASKHRTPDVHDGKHEIAIDFDLINVTSSQVLENCETFNDLSLLDVKQQHQHHHQQQQQQQQGRQHVEPLT